MRPPTVLLRILRRLTPGGWLVGAGVLLAVLALGLGAAGFRWDPFDLSRRRLETAGRAAAAARAEAAARTAEARGQAGQIIRLEAVQDRLRSLDRVTSRSLRSARTADDVSLPLPEDRAARLRDHDRELCRIAPDLGGCATAPDPAGDGDPAL
ncbi:hypothetical protein [Brevundimonas sp. R86498]|uniref:hypothetical protein n=1 Tax=Brevundimonas sp. R86498 TaxID=3093845 RepID=UPI0037CBE4AF